MLCHLPASRDLFLPPILSLSVPLSFFLSLSPSLQMDDRGKIVFEFDRIEADLLGFKVPLPMFNSEAGFVEVQARATRL